MHTLQCISNNLRSYFITANTTKITAINSKYNHKCYRSSEFDGRNLSFHFGTFWKCFQNIFDLQLINISNVKPTETEGSPMAQDSAPSHGLYESHTLIK